MKTKSLLFYLLAVALLFACDKTNEVPLSSEKELLSFKIESAVNSTQLEETIEGIIDQSEIQLIIPAEIDATKLIATFTHSGKMVFVGSEQQESGVTPNDFTEPLIYTVRAEDGTEKEYKITVDWLVKPNTDIPHFYITTDEQAVIDSKKDYVTGNLVIQGNDEFESFQGRMSIRGRGNSTWALPKKPYRIKLDSKASLLGLPAEKNWILLANYLDHSLMCNAVAMKTGQLLEMPFTHHMIPVDVTLNNEYQGNYMLTEHKEVRESRINIGDDGTLLELDVYFDQDPWQFYSRNYALPVMVQFPELDKMDYDEADAMLNQISDDFNAFEQLVFDSSFPDNDYLDYFDALEFVNYMIVYALTDNEELNHPKSTYIYRKKDEKYCMGPIWDFDWAFDYNYDADEYFRNPIKPFFWGNDSKGTLFFGKLMQDPETRELFREEWSKFRAEKYDLLVDYIRGYAEKIRGSHARDYAVWKQGSGDIDEILQKLLTWLDGRAAYLDNNVP